jgi:hypothetical protein
MYVPGFGIAWMAGWDPDAGEYRTQHDHDVLRLFAR